MPPMSPQASRPSFCRNAFTYALVALAGLLALLHLRQPAAAITVRKNGDSSTSTAQPPASQLPAVSFNIIVTTAGRNTLGKMLDSIAPQLSTIDHLTIISDKGHEDVAAAVSKVKSKGNVRHIANAEPLGFWGHGSRSHWQDKLPGDYHLNADDDDVYDPDAMNIIRSYAKSLEPHLYVFHMIRRWDGVVDLIPPLGWSKIQVKYIGTPCGVYRKIPNLPPWHGSYGGDGNFYTSLAARMNVTFVPEVIYQVGQQEDLLAIKGAMLASAR